MYEVDRINSLSDIPDNISGLLSELKEFKEEFSIKAEESKGIYKITLTESIFNSDFNTSRCIIMIISGNPCSYSISLFNKPVQKSGDEQAKKIYEIEIGECNNSYMNDQVERLFNEAFEKYEVVEKGDG